MEHSTISEIPYSLTCPIYDFLFFTMLETDMVVYRESEHHLHRLHQKVKPILLHCLEKIHTIDISHTDSSYDCSEPEEYDDYELTSKVPERDIFLQSVDKKLIKIWTRGEECDIEDHQDTYLPPSFFYLYKV
jgi:hypothetical protein